MRWWRCGADGEPGEYITYLDLGAWRAISTEWIYPPRAHREAAFAITNPDYVIVP